MPSVRACAIPESALLMKYQDGVGYADCYCVELAARIAQAEFVEAFYTTPLFRFERAILNYLAALPSTDAEARSLAAGSTTTFAVWHVEARHPNQLLVSDFYGKTRSWLMSAPIEKPTGDQSTRLYFGSAVVPNVDARNGKPRMGFAFHLLGGFHRLYSRLLLRAACRRLSAISPR